MNIPDFMPVLSRGAHRGPKDGACVMEMISFLAGEQWSDLPSCTNELLAKAAQWTNDDVADEDRHRLVPLIGRLMGTTETSNELETALITTAADYVKHLIGHPEWMVSENAADAQRLYGDARGVISSAHLAVVFSEGDAVAFLSALIDTYDRVTGRTAPAVVTEDDLARCAELTGATK